MIIFWVQLIVFRLISRLIIKWWSNFCYWLRSWFSCRRILIIALMFICFNLYYFCLRWKNLRSFWIWLWFFLSWRIILFFYFLNINMFLFSIKWFFYFQYICLCYWYGDHLIFLDIACSLTNIQILFLLTLFIMLIFLYLQKMIHILFQSFLI